jgi:hypothetical protein
VIPQWFLYLQGFAMLIMGVMLLVLRPRDPRDPFVKRWLNAGTLWSLVCVSTGVVLLAMALGYIQWPPRRALTHSAPARIMTACAVRSPRPSLPA